MDGDYTTTITIPRKAKIDYRRALLGTKDHKRSEMEVEELKGTVKITIKASDVTALRASINAVTRDVQVIEAASASTKSGS